MRDLTGSNPDDRFDFFCFIFSKRTFIFQAGLILVCRLISSIYSSGADSAQNEENIS